MNAREELRTYVDGLRGSGAITDRAVDRFDELARGIVRETSELTRTKHPLENDAGGNLVCTACWQDNSHKVHR